MKSKNIYDLIPIIFICFFLPLEAQVNYEESKVPAFDLPDILKTLDGNKIKTKEEWMNIRRPEILQLFQLNVYGRMPIKNLTVSFEISDVIQDALGGLALQKNIVVHITNGTDTIPMEMLIFLPKRSSGASPLFLGMNFYGNHTIHPDPGIPVTRSYVGNNPQFHITNNRATAESRGVRSGRWPVEMVLQRGYGLATIYYGDLDPDFDDGFNNGIHSLLKDSKEYNSDELSSISAWAFGLSVAMDYFEKDEDIADNEIILLGHSRLGKTALWAGAMDERFAVVISNDSGCGGAALSRRKIGETVQAINTQFPHWFCKKFEDFNGKENELPVDQHMLIGLIAPRPVYVASADEDRWADPRGEFLSLYHASTVYQLFDENYILTDQMPAVNHPIWAGKMAYHIRTGGHDLTNYDWEQYLNFADKHFHR